MAGSIRKRRSITDVPGTDEPVVIKTSALNDTTSDLEVYSKEVLMALISDNLPPTPTNYALYFDRLLENKSDSLKKQINNVLEFEDDADDEKTIALEKSLKEGFSSVKNILNVTANLYKNMALMTKILDKRKLELVDSSDADFAMNVIGTLEQDVEKLNSILKKQITQMKTLYESTADIIKHVENETIFDNQFGIYNKRYLLTKLDQELSMVKEFKHKSSLVMIELSKDLEERINNEKAIILMTRTIARLLMKTSRRSDIVAHYGEGVFAMVLKHTDINSAKRASERLVDLVSSSNFFLAEKEIQLQISIGISDIDAVHSSDEIIVCALDAMHGAHGTKEHYAVCGQGSETT